MKNGSLLLFVEALEVIGLNSVWSQHRLHGGRVLSHQVMSKSVVHLMCLLLSPVLSLFVLGISLLLSQLQVVILDSCEHGSASSLMCLLCGLEYLVEIDCLLIIRCLLKLTLFLLSLFLVNLLLDPLLLLLLLQLFSLLLHYSHISYL